MNIGIIVYSHAGHALSVATKLQQRLMEAGHQVTLEQLETVHPLQRGDTTAELRARPAADGYDALVFACPVRGGMPAPPMRVYLEGISSLADKHVAILVTGVMPFAWGRKQTLAQMKGMCESRGATVCGLGSVWVGPGRDRRADEVADRVSRLF
jgi:flavodoxin